MRRFATICLSLAFFLGDVAQAEPVQAVRPAPPPIREFDIATTERLGVEIYRQDTAAWVATDALRARVPDLKAAHAIGWIVEPRGQDEQVRFLRDTGMGPEIGWDIDVDAQRHARISEPAQRQLTAEELAAFSARQTAMQNVPTVCRPGYNTVVARDPQGEGWLVWLLAPMPATGVYPIGGHYRFTISPDGKTMMRRDALFASCMTMDSTKLPPTVGGRPAAAVVTHVVSSSPVETHVFIQMQMKLPLIVVAGDRMWSVENGHITDRGAISDLKAKQTANPSPAPDTSRPR